MATHPSESTLWCVAKIVPHRHARRTVRRTVAMALDGEMWAVGVPVMPGALS